MKFVLNYGHFIVLLLIIFLFIIGFYHSDLLEPKSYEDADFGLSFEASLVDKDEDGIDDYTDILNGAREFVASKPRYKSKYYDGGYPTDGYYVCTDVIWYALKNAGYDLKEMMDADIMENKREYNIDKPDPNIDFRRVKNIKVFLERFALSMTLDPTEIEKWQAGDIVVYEDHIAIVSDKRNKEGVPYIIHHAGTLKYEANALTKKKIVGHFRFSLLNDVNS